MYRIKSDAKKLLFSILIIVISFNLYLSVLTLNIGKLFQNNSVIKSSSSEIISSNQEMDQFFSSNSSDGLSPSTPYLIQDLFFKSDSSPFSLNISNTDRFLEIRNCTFIGGESYSRVFNFLNVTNLTITGCYFEGFTDQVIKISQSDNIIINSSIFLHNYKVITIEYSDEISIQDNEFRSNYLANDIGDNVDYSNFSKNVFFNNNNGLIIRGNDNCDGNMIWDNYFHQNGIQASDYSDGLNSWDNGSWGNYWSDYSTKYPAASLNGRFWDQSYNIASYNPNAYDNFPINYCSFSLILLKLSKNSTQVNNNIDFFYMGVQEPGNMEISWSFGDGITKTGINETTVNHKYNSPGKYSISIQVEDSDGDARYLWIYQAVSITNEISGFNLSFLLSMGISILVLFVSITRRKRLHIEC